MAAVLLYVLAGLYAADFLVYLAWTASGRVTTWGPREHAWRGACCVALAVLCVVAAGSV